jgi:hypothetical protein
MPPIHETIIRLFARQPLVLITLEVINVEGPTFDGSPISSTLEELGISIEKPNP